MVSYQLGLLVDKSLVVTDNTSDRTRYRLLETVRQYAQEKLSESGEAIFRHFARIMKSAGLKKGKGKPRNARSGIFGFNREMHLIEKLF